ncbi:MAG: amidohydrolase family protein [bacterium]|nr:amidohydrolase family protein [bacterium]
MAKSKSTAWSFKPLLLKEIKKQGGFVNAHVHADRAFTINPNKLDIYKKHSLEEKWDIVDEVKQNASVDDYYRRVSQAIEVMIEQGVTALGSFIDVDPVCEDRAIKGALKAREKYKRKINIKYVTQTLKGVIHPEARKWFDIGARYVDIIGGLPRRDERDYGKGEEHLDILMQTAKKHKKMLHVHVDQFNTPNDKETELLCDKTVEYGMQGKVVAIHGISLAAHPKAYREKVYQKMKKANVMTISCPMAWIDSKRSETMVPFHNSLTPVDEIAPWGIPVALGTDNICDYMVPFCDGNMWQELMLLATGCRFTDLEELVNIATVNGRKVLGIK